MLRPRLSFPESTPWSALLLLYPVSLAPSFTRTHIPAAGSASRDTDLWTGRLSDLVP